MPPISSWAWTRATLIYVLLLILFSAYFFYYASASSANVAYLSWFAHVPTIEKHFAGTLTLSDLIQRYGEHGLFGYNLLLLFNLEFFRLNVLFDAYLNAIAICVIGGLVLWSYVKSAGVIAVRFDALLFAAPLLLCLFSVAQGSSGAMETQVRLGTLTILVLMWGVDRSFKATDVELGFAHYAFALLAVVTAVLLFGTLYSFGGFPLLFALCGATAFMRRERRLYGILVMAALIISVFAYVKFYSLVVERPPGGITLSPVAWAVFGFKFMCAYLGSASLSRTLWEDRIIQSEFWMIVNGFFVVVVHFHSIFLFFRSQMNRKTLLPLLMLGYSVGVGLLVLIGRGPLFGWTGGTNYWYAVHVKFGLAGCLWTYAYVWLHQSRPMSAIQRWLLLFPPVVISVSVIASNFADWKRAPHVKSYFEAMVPYAYSSLPMPIDARGETPFRASPQETSRAIDVFRRHGLTYFSRFTPITGGKIFSNGLASPSVFFGDGWHGAELKQRWISGRAELLFRSELNSEVMISGYIPGFLAPNALSVIIEGEVKEKKLLAEGAFNVTCRIPSNAVVSLVLQLDRKVVPSEVGMGADRRELGAIINEIVIK